MSITSGSFPRERAAGLDAADPLARFRDRFVPQDAEVVAYLDGNSLGRPLRSIADAWADLAGRQWPGRLIRGWSEGWMSLPQTVGDELAAATLGAAPGQTVIADSTTINFYKVMRAAVALRPGRPTIVIDRDNFPTDRYVVEAIARDLKLNIAWLQAPPGGGVTPEMIAAVAGEDTAVFTLSHVAYRSGFLADARRITEIAHAAGALVVLDLCHSVGSCEISLDDWDVDFAVGCTYKFVGAGPGAPAFIYANAAHHTAMDQPLWGWLGRKDSFAMDQGYLPAPGIRSMISGTPSIPGILAVREGAKVIAEAGIGAIRAKSLALTEMALALHDEWLVPRGFHLVSPRAPAERGSHVSVARSDAQELTATLIAAGVIPDFRTPNVIRLGLSPLPNSYTEVWDGMAALAQAAGPVR